MKIGIVAIGDPADVRTWSGIPHFMVSELEKRLGPTVYLPGHSPRLLRVATLANEYGDRLFGRRYVPGYLGAFRRLDSLEIGREAKRHGVDVIVSITADHKIGFLRTRVPVIQLSDTIFGAIENYYPRFSRLWDFASRAGHDVARRALSASQQTIFPSRWAARAAQRVHAADSSRLHVVPYGANLSSPPSRDAAINCNRRERCRLLFVGVEWERKGADVAYETMLALRAQGIDAELCVVGCQPPAGVVHENLRLIPFMNKQIPEQLAAYEDLWLSSAFFVLPSRQETFGAVFCEAAAYGVPALAAHTGGVEDAVTENESGYLLPLEARGDAYAERIAAIWRDPQRYQALVVGARNRFERTLNWSSWGEQVAPIIAQAVAQGGSA